MESSDKKELNLAQRIRIKEELEMVNQEKQSTDKLDRLIEAGSNPARSTNKIFPSKYTFSTARQYF